jgi:cell division protein FtsA
MDELLRIIRREVSVSGLEGVPPGGLVLTGGSAKLSGLQELANNIWPGPVRIGVPTASTWVPDDLEDPSFATALGLLLWDAKQQHGTNGNGHSKRSQRGKHWLSIFSRKSQV